MNNLENVNYNEQRSCFICVSTQKEQFRASLFAVIYANREATQLQFYD